MKKLALVVAGIAFTALVFTSGVQSAVAAPRVDNTCPSGFLDYDISAFGNDPRLFIRAQKADRDGDDRICALRTIGHNGEDRWRFTDY